MDINELRDESTSSSLLIKDNEADYQPIIKHARQQRILHIAVAGCSHGQMDIIYERLKIIENQRNKKFDLLLCCGDFQVFFLF
jgi:hypothetical protein